MVEDHLDELAASDNAIVILAPKLSAAKAKKLVAKAKVEYKFDTTAPRESARGFNSNLVNALSARSREKLWLEINRALLAGDAPEMLHGLLHWRARDLMEKGSRAWTPQEARQFPHPHHSFQDPPVAAVSISRFRSSASRSQFKHGIS